MSEHQWTTNVSDHKYHFKITSGGFLYILVQGYGSSDWKPAYEAAKQFGWHSSFPLDCVCRELLAIKNGTRLESILKSLQSLLDDVNGA